jgi:uncharacterized protein YndB with AHSA1/START domain
MARTRRSRTVAATPEALWVVIADPDHLPRWWPNVQRMEGVGEDRWTQVMLTKRGKPVRLDFRLVASEPPTLRLWEQELLGTPFERWLDESITEIRLEPEGEGTRVTIEQREKPRGYSRLGGLMLRRATRARLDEALDGLARIAG